MITKMQPDTNAVSVRGDALVIHFDEVVAEHPSNASTLGDLVLISPRYGPPKVDWHRSSINIHPKDGWRKNTTYTVTLLPGVADLRGNVRMTPTVVTFSTGPAIPTTVLGGTLFDWASGTPIRTGMIEAHPVTDTTLVYIAATDSLGHYSMRGLAPAQYAVRGYNDSNHNRALDPGEVFDTSAVYLADTLNLELLAFAHDSTGPKLGTAVAVDSVTINATFDAGLDPRLPLATSQFAIVGPDSARIPITSITITKPDTVSRTPVRAPLPQTAVPLPSPTPPAPVVIPKPTRPLLIRAITIVVGKPLTAGATYTLHATDATSPTGRKLSSDKTFQVPHVAQPAADTTHTGSSGPE
jgi:hypothetical protein